MLGLAIAVLLLATQVAVARWLYRSLRAKVAADQISRFSAAGGYFVAMAAIPIPVGLLNFFVAGILYINFRIFFEPAWDVGLAITSYLCLFVSAAIAFVSVVSFAFQLALD